MSVKNLQSTSSGSIVCVVGARPNFMKMAPILNAFSKASHNFKLLLIHTGQHYDEAMSGQLFAALSLPQPDVNLAVGSGSHAVQTAEVMIRFDALLDNCVPRCVIVVGDVNSTLACALVAVKRNIPVMHVESGLRSGDRSMPEEINRILTDQISSRLYITEPSAAENLRREGVTASSIKYVGNVMIDSLLTCRQKAISPQISLEKAGFQDFFTSSMRFAVATFHRPSNVDDLSSLESLVQILEMVARKLRLVLILHPRTRDNVMRFALMDRVRQAGIAVLPPQGYLEMLGLMGAATVVLTDSGGLQEETTALGVPCLTVRSSTERPITVEEGTNTLVSPDVAVIASLVDEVLEGRGKQGRIPALWDGRSAERIVDDVLEYLAATSNLQANGACQS